MTNYVHMCYYSFHFLCVYNNNCSINLYNKDLQATIILFIPNGSSHKTDEILSELPLLTLSCLLYRMVSSIINALEREYLCLLEICINVNKFLAVLLLAVYLYIHFFLSCTLLSFVYSFIAIFYTDVVAIFLYTCWSCKQAHYFCFCSFWFLFCWSF